MASTYYVWARVLGPNSSSDSFFVSMDIGAEDIYDAAEDLWSTQWQWTRVNGRAGSNIPLMVNPRTFALSAGPHAIRFRMRDANCKVDRIFIRVIPLRSGRHISTPTPTGQPNAAAGPHATLRHP